MSLDHVLLLMFLPSSVITVVAVFFMAPGYGGKRPRFIAFTLFVLGLTAWLWFPWFWYSIENVARWNFDNVTEVMK